MSDPNDRRSEAAIRDDADTVHITVAVPEWVVYWLDEYAAEAGISRAALVRRGLVQFLKSVAFARGAFFVDSDGGTRADLIGDDTLIDDRSAATVHSMLSGRRGLIAMPRPNRDDPESNR